MNTEKSTILFNIGANAFVRKYHCNALTKISVYEPIIRPIENTQANK